MSQQIGELRRDLEAVKRRLDQVEGYKTSLKARDEVLVTDVGLAKGRLSIKGNIDRFLEQLQYNAHQRSVGSYENLLSALVREVLPGEYPIGLELYAERGLPALDIFVNRPDGRREDVMDDNGGAMTNVVSAGLHMIAIARSRTRPFLALDEADCWIATPKIPNFYKVLKNAGSKLGLQCLVISHHDISMFGDDITIARLHGSPDNGMTVESAAHQKPWEDDAKGIRSIRLIGFQAYQDETLRLSPGVNALIGDNNRGKSVWMRALRAVFYGEARDSLIRHGEKQCVVEVELENNRILQWSRQPRRNPVNVWKLLDDRGQVVEEEGMVYETGGRNVPDWVEKLYGISKMEGLDIHIAHQKLPVFLLGETPSKRASVLSIGQESSYIRDMIAMHKEDVNRDNATVRNGEAEISRIRDQLFRLEKLDDCGDLVRQAEAMIEAIEQNMAKSRDVETTIAQMLDAKAALSASMARHDIYAQLPERSELDRLSAVMDGNLARSGLCDRIEALRHDQDVLTARKGIYLQLPPAAPTLKEGDAIRTLSERLERARDEAARCERRGEVYADLPVEMPELTMTTDLILSGRRLRDLTEEETRLSAFSAIYNALPERVPDLRPAEGAEVLAGTLGRLGSERTNLNTQAADLTNRAAVLKQDITKLTEEMGGECPVCGHVIEDPMSLLTHGNHAGGNHD